MKHIKTCTICGEARHPLPAPVKKMLPMTAKELALLPRGTAFVHGNGWKMYNPQIIDCTDGTLCIGTEDDSQFVGYRLPGSTDIIPFTKEVVEQ